MSLSVLLACNFPRSIFNRKNTVSSCYSTAPSASSSSSDMQSDPLPLIRYPEKNDSNTSSSPQSFQLISTTATANTTIVGNNDTDVSNLDLNLLNEEKEEQNISNANPQDILLSTSTSSRSSNHHLHNLTSALGCGGELSDILSHQNNTSHNHNQNHDQHNNSTNTITSPPAVVVSEKTKKDLSQNLNDISISEHDKVDQVANNTLTTSSSSTPTNVVTIPPPINITATHLHNDPDFIPQRYIDGCEGNMKEAKRRWEETKKWRAEERVDEVLTESQPHYFTIKAFYPNYHCGRSKDGKLVYYERPGGIHISEMKKRGVTVDDMFRHWLFLTEYQFKVFLHDDETAKTISIFDVENINSSFLTGDPYHYFKKTVTAANHHYVERSYCIFVVNAPLIMNIIWSACKQFIHPNSQKKVRILSKKDTLKGLQEFIDLEQIPDYYGGLLKCPRPDNVPPTVIPTSSSTPLLANISTAILNASATTATTTNTSTTLNNNNNNNNNNKPLKSITGDTKASPEGTLSAELTKMKTVVDKDNCRFYSPETLELNQYVHELNTVNNITDPLDPWLMVDAVSTSLVASTSPNVSNTPTTVDKISSMTEPESDDIEGNNNIAILKQQQSVVQDEQKQEPLQGPV